MICNVYHYCPVFIDGWLIWVSHGESEAAICGNLQFMVSG